MTARVGRGRRWAVGHGEVRTGVVCPRALRRARAASQLLFLLLLWRRRRREGRRRRQQRTRRINVLVPLAPGFLLRGTTVGRTGSKLARTHVRLPHRFAPYSQVRRVDTDGESGLLVTRVCWEPPLVAAVCLHTACPSK